MLERNIEPTILRELHSKHTLSELNHEQRQELRVFCETWEDILINLSSISDYSHAKGNQIAQKKYDHLSISSHLRSELFFWIAYRNHEGSSFDKGGKIK